MKFSTKRWTERNEGENVERAPLTFFLIYRMYRRSGVESEIFVSFFTFNAFVVSPAYIFSQTHFLSLSCWLSYILMCATVDYLVYNTTATATATKFISSFLHATISSLKDMHMGCAVWWDQITYINLFSWSYILLLFRLLLVSHRRRRTTQLWSLETRHEFYWLPQLDVNHEIIYRDYNLNFDKIRSCASSLLIAM